MKTVILCGGRGTRLYPDTELRPKPIVEVGKHPILWHIMKIYSHYKFNEFVLALGYKGEEIKKYFTDYSIRSGNIHLNLSTDPTDLERNHSKNWQIELIDTGMDTLTGGRLARLESHLRDTGTFMLTYGDGLADINVKELVKFHKSHGKFATVTAVRPIGRFGVLKLEDDNVIDFHEKPQASEGWINGGYFVFEPEVFNYLGGDDTVLEGNPMEQLAQDGQLMAYKHHSFWHCMDTPRDRDELNEMWSNQQSKWKVWK